MFGGYRNWFRSIYGHNSDNLYDWTTGYRNRNRYRTRWRINHPRPIYDGNYDHDRGYMEDDDPEIPVAVSRSHSPAPPPATPPPTTPPPATPPPVIGGDTGGSTGGETGGDTSGETAGDTGGDSGNNEATTEEPTNPIPESRPKRIPPFHVLDIDYNETANRKEHNTDKYEHKGLIIRRGAEFKLNVKVDRKFEKGEDVIKLQFMLGNNPQESKGTMFTITPRPDSEIDTKDASAVIDDVEDEGEGSLIKLRVTLACDSVIGRFTFVVRIRNKEDKGNDRKYIKYKAAEEIIVLFNPWSKEDSVYMEEDSHKFEYVLNERGQIYTGSSYRPRFRRWAFAQFDKESLDAAIYILDNSSLPWEAYGNPVRVSRTLTAMVNSNDGDKGILTGNWSGNYDDGTSPTTWNGSGGILEEYMETKRAVQYGQCWVFSGVLTTVCRALGIPTRSVTNFDSAHDTDMSMTIDYHVDEDGNALKHLNDSVWNFHVWNEAWFTRPDLPEGYDGWQAFDSTPQEQSDGVMQCGPAPIKAIKEGEVQLGFDTKFIFAEVNGDKVTWEVNSLKERTPIKVVKDKVGAKISTKAVGKNEREDVTDHYKYPEGSTKERDVVKRITAHSTRRDKLRNFYEVAKTEDVKMSFDGSMTSNGDVTFVFKAENTTQEERTVTAIFHVLATYYTGITGNDIEDHSTTLTLAAGKEEEYTWMTKGDWVNSIEEDATIGVYVTAKVKETTQRYSENQSFDLEKPDLEMEVSSNTVTVWDKIELTISITNPLDVKLTKSYFVVEGAGIKHEKKIKLQDTIGPHEKVSHTLKVTPKMVGTREILASFHSRQLVNITGQVEIEVLEKEA